MQVYCDDCHNLGLSNILLAAERKSHKLLSVFMKKFGKNEEAIKAFMKSKGYTCIRRTHPDEETNIFVMIFTETERIDVRDELDIECLYHVTSKANRETILKNARQKTCPELCTVRVCIFS